MYFIVNCTDKKGALEIRKQTATRTLNSLMPMPTPSRLVVRSCLMKVK